MVQGIIIGVVKDNVDPEGLHRVLVEYPISSAEGSVESTWARICSPMAGANRGLVVLPDVNTEVAMCFSYRSLTPYVLGGVYNGKEDKPEPYHNDDGENNLRVFWSRNDSMIIFDDTDGKEKIQIGAKAEERLNTESGVIWQTLDAPNQTYREYSGGDTCWTAMKNISIKCTNFELKTKKSTTMKAGGKIDRLAGGNMNFNAASQVNFLGAQVLRNSGISASPTEALGSGLAANPANALGGVMGGNPAAALGGVMNAMGGNPAAALGAAMNAMGGDPAAALGAVMNAIGGEHADALGAVMNAMGGDPTAVLGAAMNAMGGEPAAALGAAMNAMGGDPAAALGAVMNATGNNPMSALNELGIDPSSVIDAVTDVANGNPGSALDVMGVDDPTDLTERIVDRFKP